ncbi:MULTISPECIES: helix-hairpin-helix domain-containing protein [Leuconostoc]|uniref:helix-hairpin-helix domain-containing protein n=1 Tax=Leuconostoc TaxID=1243 RepID=UPI000CF86D7F|nr:MULTISPECIES: helix-hairpin-helix domain-containing protein [Leuconostoc]MCT3045726.1 transporter [Leuconostoc mesenteroides]MDI6545204.1 helix-hairpin-helix domain-containing protein [Leuconostoc suionicum]MDI6650171.1 helix-hairpin-helix domain-containing protein [Leuconostoc suionicum]SPE14567.1 ComE operon protein 1 [Leuconostoc mesenteroides]SPI59835.1 ComE operon protein 1 [Leuconostoc mesenteroides]
MSDMLEIVKEKYYEYKIWIFIILFILAAITYCAYSHQTKEVPQTSLSSSIASTSDVKKSESDDKNSSIVMVDVKGAVKKPGVYNITSFARVQTAIAQAGGTLEEADMQQVNLAQKLTDGQIVYVPMRGETSAAPVNNGSTSAVTTTDNEVINLNTATVVELQTLDGIGVKKAEQIIAYREEHGGFKSIEEIKQVSGIGEKRFEALKDKVTV